MVFNQVKQDHTEIEKQMSDQKSLKDQKYEMKSMSSS